MRSTNAEIVLSAEIRQVYNTFLDGDLSCLMSATMVSGLFPGSVKLAPAIMSGWTIELC